MRCHSDEQKELQIESSDIKVLLMGNPNVGKSVIFSKLAGVNVIASNYTGTTVSFTKGRFEFFGSKGVLIDVPGVYSLDASSQAEEVAIKMLEQENPDVIVCVLDATTWNAICISPCSSCR